MMPGFFAGGAGGGGTPPVGTPHRYWRLFISEPDGSTLFCGMTELELRGTVGGADLTQPTPTTAYSSSSDVNSLNANYMAFDGSLTDGWLSNSDFNSWIKCDFDALGIGDQIVSQIAITGSYNAPDASPKDFQLQWSDDDSSWTTVLTVTGETGWTGSSDVRVFTVP